MSTSIFCEARHKKFVWKPARYQCHAALTIRIGELIDIGRKAGKRAKAGRKRKLVRRRSNQRLSAAVIRAE
jgi:hypothetical protein